MLTSSSPWLFAGCHVLLRQSVPGHPPCALISLIFFQKVCRPLLKCSFASSDSLKSLFRFRFQAIPRLYLLAFLALAFSRSVQLSRCVFAIPENDIVQTHARLLKQSVHCAGLAPAVGLHPVMLIRFLSFPSLPLRFRLASLSGSTLGYEFRQELMSP